MRSWKTRAAIAAACLGSVLASAASAQVVISQIWGGAGFVTDGPGRDCVELYNSGTTGQSLNGWTLRYSAQNSTTWLSVNLPNVTIPAKSYFLISLGGQQVGGGADPNVDPDGGGPLRALADFFATSGPDISNARGKLALVNNATAFGAVNCPGDSGGGSGGIGFGIQDFVGYGQATTPGCFEGSSWAPPGSITIVPSQSIHRKCNGLTDNNDNVSDFEAKTVALRNLSSPIYGGLDVVGSIDDNAPLAGQSVEVRAEVTGNCLFPVGTVGVIANLSPIGGSSTASMVFDGVDNRFEISQVVSAAPGAYSILLTATDSDSPPKSGTATVSLTVRAANDECTGAIVRTLGTSSFSNVGGTTGTDGQGMFPCSIGTGSIFQGVWYKFTPASSGTHSITTIGTTPSGFDSRLAVYDVCDASTAPIACGDNANGLDAQLTFTATGGTMYFIHVGSANNAQTTSTGVLNITVGSIPGGCCPPSFAACVVQTPEDCAAGGGTFGGPGTTCLTFTCPQQPGRCCNVAGACFFISEIACSVLSSPPALAGSWLSGVTCEATPCPPAGLCCVGLTCSIRVQSECAGTWTEFTSDPNNPPQFCDPGNNPCRPTGACCFASGQCTISLQTNCETPGGTYQGDNTPCNPNPCPQPPQGACCFTFDGSCTLTGQILCGGSGGLYQGDATLCSPNPCPQPGACCDDTTCSFTTMDTCFGTFLGVGITCTPTNPCDVPAGVCCRGATCNTTIAQAACVTGAPAQAGARYDTSGGNTCNVAGPNVNRQPCCYADYNKTGNINVIDLFAFLNDWFAVRQFADVGGTGTGGVVNVVDLFAFLNAWFAGGCSDI